MRRGGGEALVWEQVIPLVDDPALVRGEIDRSLAELRAGHPVDVKRDIATKELARVRSGIMRLIETYREQLILFNELRTRLPSLSSPCAAPGGDEEIEKLIRGRPFLCGQSGELAMAGGQELLSGAILHR